jgi:polar amino acid transport system permease protein
MVSSALFNEITRAFSVLFLGRNFIRLLAGLLVTIRIAAVSVALSLICGVLFGMLMTVKNKPVHILCKLYLEFMRIMPQLVLLFLAYFGLTRAFGFQISGETSALLVFTLWGTAEMGDLVRGALESIPLHQYESGRALGLTERQIFLFIIIPQTVRRLVPLSMNLITRMIKTTSLVVFVGIVEVVKVGQQIIEASRLAIPTASIAIYTVIFFMYFIVCWPLSLLAGYIEKRQKSQEG